MSTPVAYHMIILRHEASLHSLYAGCDTSAYVCMHQHNITAQRLKVLLCVCNSVMLCYACCITQPITELMSDNGDVLDAHEIRTYVVSLCTISIAIKHMYTLSEEMPISQYAHTLLCK
jgi:hypothetical protein